MKETLSDKEIIAPIIARGKKTRFVRMLPVTNVKAKTKDVIDELKDRDFLMSILAEDISVDEVEGNKFISINDVRVKFENIFKKHFGEELLK